MSKASKTIMFFLSCLMMALQVFAEQVVLDNQTSHPNEKNRSKIVVQWATSANEVEEGNQAMIYGWELNSGTMQNVERSGKILLNVPSRVKYFRLLVWSNGASIASPNLLTNWVNIVPNKTYTLQEDFLIPSILMAGTGC